MTDAMDLLAAMDPDYPARFARRFIPPGYVGHDEVLEKIADHLFTDSTERELPRSEMAQAVITCINYLRGLMFEGKLCACYPFKGALVVIDPGHWLGDDCVRQLLFGEVSDGWSLVPLLFPTGAIEAALDPASEAPDVPAPSTGGRPRKADAALAAYEALYPHGHEATGETWKQVIAKVTANAGQAVSIQTLKTAIKDR